MSWGRLTLTTLVLLAGVVGCGGDSRSDERRERDAHNAFIEAVKAGKFDEACDKLRSVASDATGGDCYAVIADEIQNPSQPER
jgi:hypothetical protein